MNYFRKNNLAGFFRENDQYEMQVELEEQNTLWFLSLSTKKNFVKSNDFFSKTLLSRNFCLKCVRVNNYRNFYTAACEEIIFFSWNQNPMKSAEFEIFREIDFYENVHVFVRSRRKYLVFVVDLTNIAADHTHTVNL